MSGIPVVRFIDITNWQSNIAWGTLFLILGKSLELILKKSQLRFDKQTIWKNYQWLRIFGHLLRFVLLAETSFIFEKLRLKRFYDRFAHLMAQEIMKGFRIFMKIEPEASTKMILTVEKIVNHYRVNKITGINKEYEFD